MICVNKHQYIDLLLLNIKLYFKYIHVENKFTDKLHFTKYILTYDTSLTSPLLIDEPVSSQQNEWFSICFAINFWTCSDNVVRRFYVHSYVLLKFIYFIYLYKQERGSVLQWVQIICYLISENVGIFCWSWNVKKHKTTEKSKNKRRFYRF